MFTWLKPKTIETLWDKAQLKKPIIDGCYSKYITHATYWKLSQTKYSSSLPLAATVDSCYVPSKLLVVAKSIHKPQMNFLVTPRILKDLI